jgi:hypothetical protein
MPRLSRGVSATRNVCINDGTIRLTVLSLDESGSEGVASATASNDCAACHGVWVGGVE